MSDLFTNFDSNGAVGENAQDINMASPSQSSPMTNNITASQNGGGASTNALNSTSSVTSKSSSTGTNSVGSDNQHLLSKPRLMELVRDIDTSTQLDEEVEELLLQLVDDFVDDAVKNTSLFAKHRKSNKVEVRDVQLHLERKYNMWIPGFGTDELRPYKRAAVTEAHKQRLALIRKTIKK